MSDLFYTGIGSRETPKDVCEKIEYIAVILYHASYTMRSGGADGADAAFETGVDRVSKDKLGKRIYVPWKGFGSNRPEHTHKIHLKAFTIASRIHPAWNRLTAGAKKLHARNIHQVLGDDLKTPSQFLICWTRGGEPIGGTRTAIICAEMCHIPVYNLGGLYGRLEPKQFVDMVLSESRRIAVGV